MKKLIAVIGAVLLAAVTSQAQSFSQFASGGTAYTAATNWLVIPGDMAEQLQNSQGVGVNPIPVLTFLSVRSLDAAATVATLTSYYSTNVTSVGQPLGATNYIAGIANTNGNVVTPWTNGFAPGGWVVMHHAGANPYVADEALQISSVGSVSSYTNNTVFTNGNSYITNATIYSTAIVFASAPLLTAGAGDTIFQETAGPIITVAGQSTTTPTTFNSGAGIISGQRKKPLLLILAPTVASATATNYIDSANANFVY